MADRDEALRRAQEEALRESERIGEPLAVERTVETSGHWIFVLNSETFLHTRRAMDSLAADVPPVVVAKADGAVSRPFAAGASPERDFVALSSDEWLIVPLGGLTDPPPVDLLASARLSREWCAVAARRMRVFRIVPGMRGEGDLLRAEVVARSPRALSAGLLALGLARDDAGRIRLGDARIGAAPDPARALVHLWIGGETTPWSVDDADVDLAVAVEEHLIGADWVRGYREPPNALTPASAPDLFDDGAHRPRT